MGEHFILKPKGGPKVKIQLVEIEPFKKFTDLTTFPLAKMYGEHLYEETMNGLKITVSMFVTGLLSRLWIKLVAKDIADTLPKDIANQIKMQKIMTRFWIACISKEHTLRGINGNFIQVCHGKQAPLKRMSKGNCILVYSSKMMMDVTERKDLQL